MRNRPVVVRLTDAGQFDETLQVARRFEVQLRGVWLETPTLLTNLRLNETWKAAPLALVPGGTGRYRDLRDVLPVLEELNPRIYLSTDVPQCHVGLQVLSSLGLGTALSFGRDEPNWSTVSELMTFALLGLAPHAPMEPFQFLADQEPTAPPSSFERIYLEDPTRYVHVHPDHRLARTGEDLTAGRFLTGELDDLDAFEADWTEGLRDVDPRSALFEKGECSYCPGWRVCMGAFVRRYGRREGCREFVDELLDVIDQHRAIRARSLPAWRP